MTNALRVADVQKVYGGKRGSTTRALDGVSFDVDRGEFVAIMGPSGSGKTTLLNCIATIDRPTSGVVSVGGVDVTKMRSRDLAKFRREQLGFVFQDSNLLDTLTCRENVALPLSIARVPVPQIDQRIAGQGNVGAQQGFFGLRGRALNLHDQALSRSGCLLPGRKGQKTELLVRQADEYGAHALEDAIDDGAVYLPFPQ